MKLNVLMLTMLVGYAAAACPMQNNKYKCNNDPMGCGWYKGDCVSCSMTMVKARCDQSEYCDWNGDTGMCMKMEDPLKLCSDHTMMSDCEMDKECRWKKKQGMCVDLKICEAVRSRRVCMKRDDCELKGRKCKTKMT
jgi:hypothetical protein